MTKKQRRTSSLRAARESRGLTLERTSSLRAARESRGLTLERAAVAAGISVAWLRQLERDPTLLSERIAARLLPVLGLSSVDEARA